LGSGAAAPPAPLIDPVGEKVPVAGSKISALCQALKLLPS
jgi:hypothetical protein